MKKLKILLGGAVGASLLLCAGLYVGGHAFDPDVELKATRQLSASAEQLQPRLDTFDGVKDWWTTAAEDFPGGEDWEVVHSGGPAEGAGLELQFVVGGQAMETWTLRSTEPGRVVWTVDFGVMEVTRTLTLTEGGGGTTMVWHDTARLESPMARWLTLMPEEPQLENFDKAMAALDRSAQPL